MSDLKSKKGAVRVSMNWHLVLNCDRDEDLYPNYEAAIACLQQVMRNEANRLVDAGIIREGYHLKKSKMFVQEIKSHAK